MASARNSGRKVGPEAIAADDGVAERNRQDPGRSPADEQAAPGRRLALVASFAEQHLAQPEDRQNGSDAGQRSRQADRRDGAAQQADRQGGRVDDHPLAALVLREEERMVALEHPQGVHAVRAFIDKQAGR